MASNNFERAANLVWGEAGHYYLFDYTPLGRKRDLHTIEVKVNRAGAHVHARQYRGD